MKPIIEFGTKTIVVSYNNLIAEVNSSAIRFCHFGCKVLGTLENIPDELKTTWDKEFGERKSWANKNEPKQKLAKSLLLALKEANLTSLTLWDTMRTGSDYWRPGKLLTDTVEYMRQSNQDIEVSYAREDNFCPPIDLLTKFRDTDMKFGDFAESYSEYLHSNSSVELLCAYILMELAKGRLSAFYCVDPYIPNYINRTEILSIPYKDRSWLTSLRYDGCHRIVLAEEVVKFFTGKGVSVNLLEVDSTFQKVHKRPFR